MYSSIERSVKLTVVKIICILSHLNRFFHSKKKQSSITLHIYNYRLENFIIQYSTKNTTIINKINQHMCPPVADLIIRFNLDIVLCNEPRVFLISLAMISNKSEDAFISSPIVIPIYKIISNNFFVILVPLLKSIYPFLVR